MRAVTTPSPSETTRVLQDLAGGDVSAAERLFPLVYDRLRALAGALMAERPRQVTLQPTALVHEAYLKIVGHGPERAWNGRAHFLAVAAKAMRHVLVDAARRRNADKRGGDLRRVTLSTPDGVAAGEPAREEEVLDLDEAMKALADLHPRHARIAELRYFAGMTVPEAAEVVGVSPTVVKEEWAMARAWLRRRLSGGDPAGR
jgi:RNA polymerase sigma factor (TIGR02999 family)